MFIEMKFPLEKLFQKKLIILTGMLIITASLLLAVYKQSNEGTIASWHMINVNAGKLQGDANLLMIGDQVVMIDAGYAHEAKIVVVPYFQKLNIKQIDHFFISHPHRDHYEGLARLLYAGIKIKNLYYKMPDPEIRDCCYNKENFLKFINYAKDRGAKLIQPKSGFRLVLPGGSVLEILHAQEGNLTNAKIDVNDLSLIMKWSINGSTVLFPGDLNMKVGTVLSSDARMQSEFLKMPHHGLSSLAPNSFFDRVDPDYVLVPGPAGHWCGERGKRAREWTIESRKPTWVNGINGHVEVIFSRTKTEIIPERVDGKCKLRAFGTVLVSKDKRQD